jgi:hypothetical protein
MTDKELEAIKKIFKAQGKLAQIAQRRAQNILTQSDEELIELLKTELYASQEAEYNPDDSVFRWLVNK